MRYMFGDWEGGDGMVKLEGLGGMPELEELRDETFVVEDELSESVGTFKVSSNAVM